MSPHISSSHRSRLQQRLQELRSRIQREFEGRESAARISRPSAVTGVTTGEGINNSKYKSSSESTEKNKFLANALKRRQENEKDHKAKEKEKEKEKDMIIEEKEKGGEHEVSEDPEKQEKEKKEEEEGEEEERSDLGLRKQKRKRERKFEKTASFLTVAAEHRKGKQKEEK